MRLNRAFMEKGKSFLVQATDVTGPLEGGGTIWAGARASPHLQRRGAALLNFLGVGPTWAALGFIPSLVSQHPGVQSPWLHLTDPQEKHNQLIADLKAVEQKKPGWLLKGSLKPTCIFGKAALWRGVLICQSLSLPYTQAFICCFEMEMLTSISSSFRSAA